VGADGVHRFLRRRGGAHAVYVGVVWPRRRRCRNWSGGPPMQQPAASAQSAHQNGFAASC
jgi:hypothetical protein